MRGDVNIIKEKLNITEIISGYVKLEKAGASFKARCPFHNEKTPSFFVSPARQNFYCFGCGAKGDIFTFVGDVEGLDFRGTLKLLAERAGVELEYGRGESKEDKEKILNVVEEATRFFEKELTKNKSAHHYITSRGVSDESIENWSLGYAPGPPSGGWRSLYKHLQSMGFNKDIMIKAGLIKKPIDGARGKEPYDVFRDRIIFPLTDLSGRIIAFSGRALSKETEPKYLNSPDTPLFTKSEVLYGLDKAKDHIRRKNYAILVEGQIDLVLSHQIGIDNTVAASGTSFTLAHLNRLKRFSQRIIIAFDGDSAGERAAKRASELGISLGLEVKVANLPTNLDPADIAEKNPKEWKDILRQSLPAVEFFFNKIEEKEKESRKIGKQIEKKLLPMIKLMGSAIEQSHFISMISKRTDLKEDILWEDLKKVKRLNVASTVNSVEIFPTEKEVRGIPAQSYREQIEERLVEIKLWQEELSESRGELTILKKEEVELTDNLSGLMLRDNLSRLSQKLSHAEVSQDTRLIKSLTSKIQKIHNQMRALEEKKKML